MSKVKFALEQTTKTQRG